MKKQIQTTEEAIDQVRANNIAYFNLAFAFAQNWAPRQMKPFTSEDFKDELFKSGHPPPDEPRVFGAVFRELSKGKKIYKHGYRQSSNPVCHNRPQTIWISHEYRIKQQRNALQQNGTMNLFTT